MTAQLARIAEDLASDAMQSRTPAADWLGWEENLPHAHRVDRAPDLATAEAKWPPAWRLVLIAGTSAGLWTLILVSLSIAGVLRLLP